jgi:hypothetical protein
LPAPAVGAVRRGERLLAVVCDERVEGAVDGIDPPVIVLREFACRALVVSQPT